LEALPRPVHQITHLHLQPQDEIIIRAVTQVWSVLEVQPRTKLTSIITLMVQVLPELQGLEALALVVLDRITAQIQLWEGLVQLEPQAGTIISAAMRDWLVLEVLLRTKLTSIITIMVQVSPELQGLEARALVVLDRITAQIQLWEGLVQLEPQAGTTISAVMRDWLVLEVPLRIKPRSIMDTTNLPAQRLQDMRTHTPAQPSILA